MHQQYGRLNLIANNSRFLILPGWHRPNIGSRVLSLTERRVAADWRTRFGPPLFLLETFVDPQRFHGGVYRAANWMELTGAPKLMLNAEQMRRLPQCFKMIPDPRRGRGRRHRLPVVLGMCCWARLFSLIWRR